MTRNEFEESIAVAEFIEHGHFDGEYYGTSFSAVRQVIESGKTCILNMFCQVSELFESIFLCSSLISFSLTQKDMF